MRDRNHFFSYNDHLKETELDPSRAKLELQTLGDEFRNAAFAREISHTIRDRAPFGFNSIAYPIENPIPPANQMITETKKCGTGIIFSRS